MSLNVFSNKFMMMICMDTHMTYFPELVLSFHLVWGRVSLVSAVGLQDSWL